MKITMTLLVRNEEDLLEDNVWFHRNQGVDSFIVMDNLSEDRTPQIIQSLAREIEIEHLTQSDDTYSQSDWLTDMSRMALVEHGADWVIHNDADEFWLAQTGSIRDYLHAVSPEVGVLRVRRHNAVLRRDENNPLKSCTHPKESILFEACSVNNHGLPIPSKCAHRASLSALILPGNHHVRGVDGTIAEVTEGLRILHYPFRTLENYKQKILFGGRAYAQNTALSEDVGATWRRHYQALDSGELETFWAETSKSKSDVLINKLRGSLFEERSVVHALSQRSLAKRDAVIEAALVALVERTQSKVSDFVTRQTELLSEIPEEIRNQQPRYYNLPYCISGPLSHLDQVRALSFDALKSLEVVSLSSLRDTFSLFPQNESMRDFMATLLTAHFSDDVRRILSDCGGRKVVLHLCCSSRRNLAERSIESFSEVGADYHHIILIGRNTRASEEETDLFFSYDGRVLQVPVPDDYENLHRKLFYGLMVLDLVADASMIIKVDDSLHLGNSARFQHVIGSLAEDQTAYAGRLIGTERHQLQWHGWHLSKCTNPLIETRGYQYPLPRIYAAGGYGYVLGRKGIEACSYMYLAMKEFFSLNSVGLEDAYVGHAMYAQGIELHNVSSEAEQLTFPGLRQV